MTTFICITISITAVFLITMALLITTRNTLSAFIFKVIPFFLGLACLFCALVLWNIIPGL